MRAESRGHDVYTLSGRWLVCSDRKRGIIGKALSMLIVGILISAANIKPKPRDIAVDMRWNDGSLACAVTETAVKNSLAAIDGISVLPESEYVVRVSAQKGRLLYRVALTWVNSGDVERSEVFDIPASQPETTYGAVSSVVKAAYTWRRKAKAGATPETYARLVEIRVRRSHGEPLQSILADLAQLAPCVDVYAEMIHVARYLWQTTDDMQYSQIASDAVHSGLVIDPESTRMLSAAIGYALSTGSQEWSNELMDRLSRIDPYHPYLPRWRAMACEANDDFIGAENWYEVGAERSPRFALDLGKYRMKYGLGGYDDLARANKFLGSIESRAGLAQYETMYGDPSVAEDLWRNVGATRPSYQEWLATSLYLQGRFTEAAFILVSLPETMARRFYLAECLTHSDNPDIIVSVVADSRKHPTSTLASGLPEALFSSIDGDDEIAAQALAYIGDRRALGMIRPRTQMEWCAAWNVKRLIGEDASYERSMVRLSVHWLDI